MTESKTPSETLTTMTEMVQPNDTNVLNNLLGGKMMHWMDIVGAIVAMKHSNAAVVTASVDNVSFKEAIKLGNVVSLTAKITRAFKTSMEVHILVDTENIPEGKKTHSNEAFFTYVAVDDQLNPCYVPVVQPESEEEQNYYESALRRRQLRLVLAGRMKPEEATELKAVFGIE